MHCSCGAASLRADELQLVALHYVWQRSSCPRTTLGHARARGGWPGEGSGKNREEENQCGWMGSDAAPERISSLSPRLPATCGQRAASGQNRESRRTEGVRLLVRVSPLFVFETFGFSRFSAPISRLGSGIAVCVLCRAGRTRNERGTVSDSK